MTEQEKVRFINDLCDSIKKDILSNVPKMPEEWDGHELRQYIADRAKCAQFAKMAPSRKAKYNNTVLVNNL